MEYVWAVGTRLRKRAKLIRQRFDFVEFGERSSLPINLASIRYYLANEQCNPVHVSCVPVPGCCHPLHTR